MYMRLLVLLTVAFFTSFAGNAQKWKSYIIRVKGDTLNCVDQKNRKQGRWVVHVDDLRGERGYEEEAGKKPEVRIMRTEHTPYSFPHWFTVDEINEGKAPWRDDME